MHVDEFLEFLFPGVNGDDPNEVVAIGGDEEDNTAWEARPWRPGEVTTPGRLYYCISTVVGPANRRQRNVLKDTAHLVRTWVIVLDDVGTKIDPSRIPVQPTTKLETSPGNFQWIYRLAYPVAPLDAHNLIESLADAGYTDGKAKRADRYMRVPGSLNTKLEVPFRARVVEHHPERQWSLARLTVAFKVVPKALGALPEELPALAPGEVDPDWDIVQELDMVKGPPARGWYPIVCPNEAQHSPSKAGGKDSSTAYRPSKGGGVFNCQHEHCKHLTTPAFREWLHKQLIPDLQAFGQRLNDLVENSAAQSATSSESVRFGPVRRPPDDDEVRAQMLESYVHVEVQNKYWSVKSKGLVERAAVDDKMTVLMKPTSLLHVYNDKGTRLKDMAVSTWLRLQDGLQRVANLTHRMGQPLIVDDCINIAPAPPERLEVEGDPELWLDLVDFVCGAQAELVLDWMALVVTALDEKPGWHIILKGPAHGTGKALMFSPLVRYLQPHKLWYGLKPADIGDKFTAFLERRLLILDELKRTTRGEITLSSIYNTIKAWTARGTGMVMIEKKNQQPYEALDLSCWAIFSNQDVPLPIEEGDRRFMVINVPEPKPEEWYKPIIKWLDEGPQGAAGWKMVISYLHWRWDTMAEADREVLRGRAPMTEAKADLIDNSAEGLDGAIRAHIRGIRSEPWPDLMTTGDIRNALNGSGELSDYFKNRLLSDQMVWKALRNAGAVQLFKGQQVTDGVSRMRLWCMRSAKQKTYEELGMGKAVVDAYRDMRSPGSAATVAKVVNLHHKR